MERYAYVDPQGHFVLCWDLGRYVNHGCDPTSRGVGTQFEIAVRDIAQGEQLTSDYAELNVIAPFACQCGSANCRGIVNSDDLHEHGGEWDEVVAAALPFLPQGDQSLWPFVADKPWVEALLKGEIDLPRRHEYDARRNPAGHSRI